MIIGFAGKAATGKTTAAHHMAPLLDKACKIIPMAMVLRDEVEAFLRAITKKSRIGQARRPSRFGAFCNGGVRNTAARRIPITGPRRGVARLSRWTLKTPMS